MLQSTQTLLKNAMYSMLTFHQLLIYAQRVMPAIKVDILSEEAISKINLVIVQVNLQDGTHEVHALTPNILLHNGNILLFAELSQDRKQLIPRIEDLQPTLSYYNASMDKVDEAYYKSLRLRNP